MRGRVEKEETLVSRYNLPIGIPCFELKLGGLPKAFGGELTEEQMIEQPSIDGDKDHAYQQQEKWS